MNIIIINTQAQLDALPHSFDEYTRIEIRSTELIFIRLNRENSSVEACGNSSVVARGNSSVVARGNSSVEAWENSSVVACGNSSVLACGNSSVLACGNSSVEANDFSMIAVLLSSVTIKKLLDYSIASFRGFKPIVELKHTTATVVETPSEIIYDKERFFDRCQKFCDDSIILYKSVRRDTLCDFQTNKIKYEGIVECPDWIDDDSIECGNGLHLSPTIGDALSYHNGKILKCRVFKSDINIYINNLTKVRCRKLEVLK